MFKTILITFTTTAGALAFAANLFLNSILGMFGLAATSVETLSKLQASHEVVQKMKSRQLRKQKQISKRFVKRSGKRVASGALAAATVGTVAVVAAMTTIEIAGYCEEQKELQADMDIINGTSTEFDLDRCFDRRGEHSQALTGWAMPKVAPPVDFAIRAA